MKDRRVAFVRGVLSDLVESLDATVRIGRWSDNESVPAPLRASAALLAERLGRANRLASDRFVGSPPALAAFSAMSDAIRRLDLALVAYQRASDKADTESALDAEIARVRSDINLDATA